MTSYRRPYNNTNKGEEWNWIRYMIGGKMFAAICLDGVNENKPVYITLKLEPLDGDFLIQKY